MIDEATRIRRKQVRIHEEEGNAVQYVLRKPSNVETIRDTS